MDELGILIDTLNEGGIVLIPGDTVFGISCDACNEEAVQKIIDLKGRNKQQSFIILVDSDAMLERYVKEVPEVAWEVIDSAIEPITIVYPQAVGLAPKVAAQDGSIAIRITADPLARRIIQKLRRPIVSTSANLSGNPTPLTKEQLDEDVLSRLDHIVTSPAPAGKKPSSIIKIGANGEVHIIRK